MAQASVLSDNDIRRVFRIIETARHAERNRLAFVLSIYAGMRVGEIAALTVGDVINQHGEVRNEIKLGAHQTKGKKARTVILSGRVRREIGAYLKSQPKRHLDSPLIFFPAESPSFFKFDAIDALQRNLRNCRHSDVVAFRTADILQRG